MSFIESNVVPLPKWIYPIQITSANQYLDFLEAGGGPEREAILDDGWYLPDELATECARAMNAVAGASGDYTVAFDRTTDKFTIATDLAYLDLLWNSGTKAASACHTAMGYASGSDDTGATSYVSDSVIPNRFVATSPMYGPKRKNRWIRKVNVSDGGSQATNFRRQERSLGFKHKFIREQDLDDWNSMLLDSGAARGKAVDFYPNSLATDFVRAFFDMKGFEPKEMLPDLPGYYAIPLSLRETIPQPSGGSSFEDFLTRTVD